MNNILVSNYRLAFKQITKLLFLLLFTMVSAITLAKSDTTLSQKPINKAKVLIVISSDSHGYWLPEVLEPYHILQQAGFIIDIASPLGGKGKASGGFRLSPQQNSWFEQSSLKKKLPQSIPANQVIPTGLIY